MAIGVLHTLVMTVLFHPVYWDIIVAGVFNTIHETSEPLWGAAVWTLFFGFLLVFAGLLLPADRKPVSRFAAYALGLILILGIVVMPTGGFWLGIPVAVGLWAKG